MSSAEDIVSAMMLLHSDGPAMRFRDLIHGLHSGHPQAQQLLGLLDAGIADELSAIVAHRQITVDDFVAHALMQHALELADSAWQVAIEQRPGPQKTAELAHIREVIAKAIRRHLQAEVALSCGEKVGEMALRHYRIGHPYIPE